MGNKITVIDLWQWSIIAEEHKRCEQMKLSVEEFH